MVDIEILLCGSCKNMQWESVDGKEDTLRSTECIKGLTVQERCPGYQRIDDINWDCEENRALRDEIDSHL